ncbi:GNAT family N-acetyltransferase [Leucobacter sp. PH1c]|uniref:GNAT family N-acetyltransferase n=1 Tax=Leucobacter sp. PH1c TaxID=1397278 RepID=UPI0004694125|nr:GNAT family N-acetyltransferase [Leucobacter sp. PH1c]
MARYLDETQAAADGLRILHEPERSRFAIYQEGELGERLVGEAHYTLSDAEDEPGAIDYDHTVVLPEFRGTGLSGLLAHRAVTDPVARGRRVHASCWFIEGYLARHPELLE